MTMETLLLAQRFLISEVMNDGDKINNQVAPEDVTQRESL